MAKTIRRTKRRDGTAAIVADMTGYSYEYVRLVRNGDRKNDTVMSMLVDYEMGKSKLIKHLEELVPVVTKRGSKA